MNSYKVRSQQVSSTLPGKDGDRRPEEAVRDFYRLDSRARRVLVIGGEKSRPVTTVGWLDDWPNLTDFDVVIINLQTLDRVTLVKLSRVDKDRLVRMRSQLFESMLAKGEIYCILAPFLAFGSYIYLPDGSMESEWSNLNWSPIGFSFTQIRGETVLLEEEIKFEEYLRQVTGWECYLNSTASINYIEDQLRRENKLGPKDEIFWQAMPLAMNRYGKPLAASLCFGIRSLENELGEAKIRLISDYLHLLPPPTKISVEQGIDLLIEEAKGMPARTLTPAWAEQYHVPGEEQLEHRMNETLRRIKIAEREQKRLFQAYRELERSKALLYEHGDNLKRAVAEAFRRMEFILKPHTPGTDLLVLQTRFGKMLIETAGRSGPAQAGDLNRLLRHAIFAQEEDGKIWKGILVFNHYRLEDPARARSAAFPAEVVAQAREMRLGLMTAEGLYATFCAVLQGSMLREEFEERLYRNQGIIPMPSAEPHPAQAVLGFHPPLLELEKHTGGNTD